MNIFKWLNDNNLDYAINILDNNSVCFRVESMMFHGTNNNTAITRYLDWLNSFDAEYIAAKKDFNTGMITHVKIKKPFLTLE